MDMMPSNFEEELVYPGHEGGKFHQRTGTHLPCYRILILYNPYHWSFLVGPLTISTVADLVATHMHQLPAAIVICVCGCLLSQMVYVIGEIIRSVQQYGS